MAKNFNVAPYFDDYNEAKEFIRILFRPGLAVQARELTQSQTILQKQIERVGSYLFEEGSEVINSQTTFDLEYSYVKLQGEIDGLTVARLKQLLGSGNVTVKLGTLEADIVDAIDAEDNDPITFYVKYRNSGDGSTRVFADNSVIGIYFSDTVNPATQVGAATTATTNATGYGSVAHINAGTRFIGGFFLNVDAQSIILDKYNNIPSADIGLRVVEEIITPEMDASLLDNAQNYPNYAATGAHRYRIKLLLDKKGDNTESFVRILTLKDGVLQEDRRQISSKRNGIDEVLAKRMFDQSGNFIVDPFKVEVREHLKVGNNRGYFNPPIGDESKLVLDIDSGKAYISGYEVSTVGSEYVEIDKARDTAVYNNAVIGATYGAYIVVNNLVSSSNPIAPIDFTSYPTVDLTDGVVILGTARIRNIEMNKLVAVAGIATDATTEWKIYLFDINITGDVADITTVSVDTWTADVVGEFSSYSFENCVTAEPLPFNVAASVKDTSYVVRRQIGLTAVGTSVSTSLSSGETFEAASLANYALYDNDDGVFYDLTGGNITFSSDFGTISIDDLPPSVAGNSVTLYYTVNKNSADGERKTKTLSLETTIDVSGAVTDLGFCDIESIVKVRLDGDVTNTEYKDSFVLDNGQRDGFYARGALKKKDGVVLPVGTLKVTFKYYTHSSGDYFTAESYPDFENIPTYVSSFGEVIVLRDSIDFRPLLPTVGALPTGECFVPNGVVRGDITFYLGRIDKVIADEKGKFFVKRGSSALKPVSPPTPNIGMTLYEVAVPPYTFDPSDVRLEYIENKRFTMRDIGKLESRIENLEYYTTLNLLEQSTAEKDFSDGVSDRFKNGFLVDAFSGHGIGDSAHPDYQCSIDQSEGECRPTVNAEHVGVDVSSQTGCVVSDGGLLSLNYTEVVLAQQNLASRTENVNPYAVFSWNGTMKMTPSSDTWIDVNQKPTIVINREETFSNVVNIKKPKNVWQSIYAYWQNVWFGQQQAIFGVAREKSNVATSTSTTRDADGTITTTSSNTITTKKRAPFRTKIVQRTVRQTVSDRIVDLSIVPFIREKTIEWEVSRMKPNTILYPFFDGVNVTAEVNLGTTIKTDASGYASGTFKLPNTEAKRFKTGKRIFRLIDNSNNDELEALTYADGVYSASGVLETRQASISSTRETVTTKNKLRLIWVDPLAQSFLVEQDGGVFITSIDVAFATKDEAIPVTLQLRNMVNGYPGQTVVPLGEKTLEPVDVTTSEDGSAVTRFTFDSPVYLQDGNEYCFVVMANSQKYNMYVSQMGELDIITNEPISKQPFAGVLFKSQNASTWTADQTQDLKFVINRASFNINQNSVIEFQNQDVLPELLEENPLMYSGGWKVRQDSHCLTAGSYVQIAGATTTVPVNGLWEVSSIIDNDTYRITPVDAGIGAAGINDVWVGGTVVTANKNFGMDAIHAIFQNMESVGKDEESGESLTSIDWFIKATENRSVNGETKQVAYRKDSAFIPFEVNDTFEFDEPKVVASLLNETQKLAGDRSFTIRAVLGSKKENVSPIIDMQRIGVLAISNRTSYPDVTEMMVEELRPQVFDTEKAASTRYITKKVSLNNPAEGVRVIFDANRPATSDFKVFIKISGTFDETPFNELPWVEVTDQIAYPRGNASPDEVNEYTFGLDDLTPFSLFSIKVVSLSKDSSSPPRFKNFRAIAVT